MMGGAGEDTINSFGTYTARLSGRDGDDIVTAGGVNLRVSGDAGTDGIMVVSPAGRDEANATCSGDSDDTLTASNRLDQPLAVRCGVDLFGEAGQDDCVLDLTGVDGPATDPDEPGFGTNGTLQSIGDFDPSVDRLVVDLTDRAVGDAFLSVISCHPSLPAAVRKSF